MYDAYSHIIIGSLYEIVTRNRSMKIKKKVIPCKITGIPKASQIRPELISIKKSPFIIRCQCPGEER